MKPLVAGASPVEDPQRFLGRLKHGQETYPNMSYKKKKLKKSRLNQLKYSIELVKNVLFQLLFGRGKMRQVESVVSELRKRAKLVKPNNLKINEWVNRYLEDCTLNGKPVNILTQWCVSSMLKRRFKKQGGQFVPTKKELRVLQEEIPALLSLFSRNGFRVNWWITFNTTFIDAEGIPQTAYKEMLLGCFKGDSRVGVVFADWEDDVLGKKPEPDQAVLDNFLGHVSEGYFKLRVEQLSTWAQKESDWQKTTDELEKDVRYTTACEVAEAKLLTFRNPLFGKEDWLLIPLDDAEAYDSFTIPVNDFKRRIVPVLSLCPWRMNS